jgi:COP9 signalosome complex subunit 5
MSCLISVVRIQPRSSCWSCLVCRVAFSATATVEMTMHAFKGGDLEVMGLLLGKIENKVFYVLSVFPLPVEGTETRVNAQSQANEYIVNFLETLQLSGNTDYVVGWYHSHPGYGCWLSGIDVNTQKINQQYQDPFLAVVIDPHETIKTEKVAIGGFRTFPENHSGNTTTQSQQSIPLEKVEEYGVHAHEYYEVGSSFFKSSGDEFVLQVIKRNHWADCLTHESSHDTVRDSIVIREIKQVAQKVKHSMSKKVEESRLSEVVAGGCLVRKKVDAPQVHLKSISARGNQLAALSWNDAMADVVKDLLFL